MLTYHLTEIFSIMFDKNLNMTTFKCFGNVMCLQGSRLETLAKKKNLILEGVPEVEGLRENLEKTIGEVLDQLAIPGSINFEASYRVGPYNKNRTRPIMVCFEKLIDRQLVYSKRMELKLTRDFQGAWLNEDLGAISKRKRGIIRLITREPQQQGIDCKSGKYALRIDNKKFDLENLEELPPPPSFTRPASSKSS